MECYFCQGPINENHDYQRVFGWVQRRSGGGANQIALKDLRPVWACAGCVETQKRGLHWEQAGLFDASAP